MAMELEVEEPARKLLGAILRVEKEADLLQAWPLRLDSYRKAFRSTIGSSQAYIPEMTPEEWYEHRMKLYRQKKKAGLKANKPKKPKGI